MDIIFATGNKNKLQEAREILGKGFNVLSPSDVKIINEIPEDGDTLLENSIQKAKYIWEITYMPVFADDTGLEVDFLGGAPGVHSARYAGPKKDSNDNIAKLLDELSTVPESENDSDSLRSARFRCVISLYLDGNIHTFDGVVEGVITTKPSGNGGFGYDPIFRPLGYDKCFSELSHEEKNAISHRGKAMTQLVAFLKKYKKL